MITHDLDSLFRTCDRVSVIVDGRMVSDTLPGILKSTNPWIRAYFHGPRARGAELAAAGGDVAEAPHG
jgi:phospholipid/cholesterol/gamma-HCH transport system ATP-binding protein